LNEALVSSLENREPDGNARFGTPGNRHGGIYDYHFIPLCLRALYEAFLICVIGVFLDEILAQGWDSAKFRLKITALA